MSFINEQVPSVSEEELTSTFNQVMRHVSLWMGLGLFVTAFVSAAMVYTPLIYAVIWMLKTSIVFYGLLLAEIGIVWWLSARINRLSIGAARAWFLLYAALNGVTFSVIYLVYTASSIAGTFLATSVLFGGMAVLGYTAKVDLSHWRNYLMLGLLGLIIGSVINLFLANSTLDWVLTYVGIALFLGLTLYDTQWIRLRMMAALQAGDPLVVRRVGIIGALRLYLDFINLFLRLLRLFGRRRR